MKQEFILLIISPLIFLILFIPFTSAAGLPTVNGDSNQWGTILNGFLQTEHTSYGNHSNVTVNGSFSVFNSSNLADTFLFVNESFGRVGIGTTNPSARLEVNGSDSSEIRINSQTNNLFSILSFQESSALLFDIATLNSNFGSTEPETSNSTHIRSRTSIGNIRIFNYLNGDSRSGLIVASNNNVGIGIASPQTKFEVNGTLMVNQSETTEGKIGLWANGTHVGVGIKGSNYLFQVGNVSGTDGRSVNLSNVLFVNESSGRVGIGIKNSSYLLHVGVGNSNDSAMFDGTVGIGYELRTTLLSGGNEDITLVTRGRYGQETTFIAGGGTGNSNYVNFQQGGNYAGNVVSAAKLGVDATTQNFNLYSYAGHILFSPLASKNVGINTTVPNYLLSVANGSNGNAVNLSSILYINGNTSRVGIGTPTPQYSFQVANSTTDGRSVNLSNVLFVNESSGFVGIRTASPGERLEVVGNINVTSGNVTAAYFKGDGSLLTGIGGGDKPWNASGTDVYLNNTGSNVGIGTASLGSKLTVFGGDLNISNSATGTVFYVQNSTGRVGIGTTVPNSALHVVGSINASSTLIAADGTAAAPSYTFNNDSNTGIRKGGGADNISIVTGGADRLTVDSSGRVGIGETSPTELLHIGVSGGDSAIFNGAVGIGNGLSGSIISGGNTDIALVTRGQYAQSTTFIAGGGTGNNNYLSFQSGGVTYPDSTYTAASIGVDATTQNFNLKVRTGHILLVTSSKNVGINTTVPNYLLSVANGSTGNAVNLSSILYINGNTSGVGIGTATSIRYLFEVANTSTIGRSVNLSNVLFVNESSGRVGIRDSEPGYGLDVVADINSDDCFREAGTQVAGTCASDIRLKKNIQPLQGSLNKILQLKPVEFEWKEGIEKLGGTIRYVEGRQVGLIAQNVQQVMPHLVKEKDSYLSIEYNLEMQMMLINAIQEQQGLIRTQYIEIQKLTKRISALEEKMK